MKTWFYLGLQSILNGHIVDTIKGPFDTNEIDNQNPSYVGTLTSRTFEVPEDFHHLKVGIFSINGDVFVGPFTKGSSYLALHQLDSGPLNLFQIPYIEIDGKAYPLYIKATPYGEDASSNHLVKKL